MSYTDMASLIAAISFAVLVAYIVLNLRKLMNIFSLLEDTVKQSTESLEVVTKDVDGLSGELQTLLGTVNVLAKDVNQKLEKVDPLFDAIGDVGETVSDVNDSTRNLASKVSPFKKSSTVRVGKSVEKNNKK